MTRHDRMYPYLFALEEALLVTVGDVQRESQDPGSVFHALNEIIQSSPAGPLHRHTHRERHRCEYLCDYNVSLCTRVKKFWLKMPLKVCEKPQKSRIRRWEIPPLMRTLVIWHFAVFTPCRHVWKWPCGASRLICQNWFLSSMQDKQSLWQ